MSDTVSKEWYVIHTYSGYENKVKDNIEKRVESLGMEDKNFQNRCSRRKKRQS